MLIKVFEIHTDAYDYQLGLITSQDKKPIASESLQNVFEHY